MNSLLSAFNFSKEELTDISMELLKLCTSTDFHEEEARTITDPAVLQAIRTISENEPKKALAMAYILGMTKGMTIASDPKIKKAAILNLIRSA